MISGLINNSQAFYHWVAHLPPKKPQTSAGVYWKTCASSFGHDRDFISAPAYQWFTRDLQREMVAMATADSKSATSFVWPYTDMFNCVMPAVVLLKEARGRKHRTKSKRIFLYFFQFIFFFQLGLNIKDNNYTLKNL